MSSKRRVNSVTLRIITCVDLVVANKAIFKSMESLSFQFTKTITPTRLAICTHKILGERPFNSSLSSIKACNHYCVYDLDEHIYTKFCLLIQQEGYIVNLELLRNWFIDYDDIGAPCPEIEKSYAYLHILAEIGSNLGMRGSLR